MDLNSESFNCSIFNLHTKHFVHLERMFGARMVHNTSMHQIFRALQNSSKIITSSIFIEKIVNKFE